LQGAIVDAATHVPVSGASITIPDPPGSSATTSDAEGLFTISADFDGGETIEVRAAGYGVWRKRVNLPNDPDHDRTEIALARAGSLEVTVWDDATDSLCAGCSVGIIGSLESRTVPTDGSGVARFEG